MTLRSYHRYATGFAPQSHRRLADSAFDYAPFAARSGASLRMTVLGRHTVRPLGPRRPLPPLRPL